LQFAPWRTATFIASAVSKRDDASVLLPAGFLRRSLETELRASVRMAAAGQTRKVRACPLHVCFTSKPGRFGARAGTPEKGQKETFDFKGHVGWVSM
jgi:hypothetical protein